MTFDMCRWSAGHDLQQEIPISWSQVPERSIIDDFRSLLRSWEDMRIINRFWMELWSSVSSTPWSLYGGGVKDSNAHKQKFLVDLTHYSTRSNWLPITSTRKRLHSCDVIARCSAARESRIFHVGLNDRNSATYHAGKGRANQIWIHPSRQLLPGCRWCIHLLPIFNGWLSPHPKTNLYIDPIDNAYFDGIGRYVRRRCNPMPFALDINGPEIKDSITAAADILRYVR